MLSALKNKTLLTLLTFVSLLSLISFLMGTYPVNAACYCNPPEGTDVNGNPYTCQCLGTADLTGASYPAEEHGISLLCDTQLEATTFWSTANPICGTNTEIIPYCAPEGGTQGNPNNFTCWGAEWQTGATDSRLKNANQTWVEDVPGPFEFNGVSFGTSGVDHDVWVCQADNLCCWRDDIDVPCVIPPDYPGTPRSCQDTPGATQSTATVPDWCSTYPGVGDDTSYSCTDMDDPEFHTFRPYPKEPCDQIAHELALFCGNTFNLTDGFGIEKIWEISDGVITLNSWSYWYTDQLEDPSALCEIDVDGEYGLPGQLRCLVTPLTFPCPIYSDVMELCTFNIFRDTEFFIIMDDTFFPIMGNTELVTNEQNRDPDNEELTDAQKVNEYVSWYLNGARLNPVEYGPLTDELLWAVPTLNPFIDWETNQREAAWEFQRQVVDYSGPINRLLPHRIRRDVIEEEIYNAHITQEEGANIRHNQIIGCAIKAFTTPDWSDWSKIVQCYSGGGIGGGSKDKIRMTEYFTPDEPGDLIPPKEDELIYDNDVPVGAEYFENAEIAGTEPYFYISAGTFDFIKWYDDYLEWRGKLCVRIADIPFSDILPDFLENVGFCFNNPFDPDYMGNLYFTVPKSSTEDRIGMVEIIRASIFPLPIFSNARVDHRILWSDVLDTNDEHDPLGENPYSELYFAHMQEGAELAHILQTTFAPCPMGAGGPLGRTACIFYQNDETLITPVTDVEPPRYCHIREVRSNPGDNLYPETMLGDIQYESEVDCEYTTPAISNEEMDYPLDPPGRVCDLIQGTCTEAPDDINITCCETYGALDCAENYECLADDGLCNYTHPTNPVDGTAELYNCDIYFGIFDYGCHIACLEGCEDIPQYLFEYVRDLNPGIPITECPGDYKCVKNLSCDDPEILSATYVEKCDTAVMIEMESETSTPKADEVWSRLVAGDKAVFKKFYPKIGEDAPIREICDIPAASPVKFTSPWIDSVSNPVVGREVPELYFAHIGGVHQYFLKGIQTAIRPKDYGETQPPYECPDELSEILPPDAATEECIGRTVAEYMDGVINSAGNLTHIKFTTPAWNMTNEIGVRISNYWYDYATTISQLDAIAGNAYNTYWGTPTNPAIQARVTDHVEYFLGASLIGTQTNLPVVITETGIVEDSGPLSEWVDEMHQVNNHPRPILGALIFNAFNINPGGDGDDDGIPDWQEFWDRIGIQGILDTCGTNCPYLGSNSGSYYYHESFYNDSATYGMGYTLEISNADDSTTRGVQLALERSIVPIIRVGWTYGPGPEASVYGAYLRELDQRIESWYPGSGTGVYAFAIAGPNEPQSEWWASEECF